MDISIVRTRHDLEFLANDWNTLLEGSSVNSLFLTWEWVQAWLDSLIDPSSIELFVIVIRDESQQLLGIAPCYKAKYKFMHFLPVTVLRVIGDEGTGGEYPGLIAQRENEQAITQKIFTVLNSHTNEWDVLWFTRLSGWDGQKEQLTGNADKSGYGYKARKRSFSYFTLPDTYADFEASLSSNRRQQFRRQAKKVYKKGTVEITRCDTKEELPEHLQILFELHEARRRLLGDAGTFKRKPQQIGFYNAFTAAALEKGWLWFYALRDDNEIKAVQIGYVRGGIFYQLQEGFDPDYFPGAGNVLRQAVIKDCIEQGVKEFDFLGEHTEHKRRWTAVEREGWDLLIAGKGVLAKLIVSKPFWPTGRYLKPAG